MTSFWDHSYLLPCQAHGLWNKHHIWSGNLTLLYRKAKASTNSLGIQELGPITGQQIPFFDSRQCPPKVPFIIRANTCCGSVSMRANCLPPSTFPAPVNTVFTQGVSVQASTPERSIHIGLSIIANFHLNITGSTTLWVARLSPRYGFNSRCLTAFHLLTQSQPTTNITSATSILP